MKSKPYYQQVDSMACEFQVSFPKLNLGKRKRIDIPYLVVIEYQTA